MKPFRIRLTVMLMILIGVSVLAAGLTMAKVFEDSHVEALEENMTREINLLQSTFSFITPTDPNTIQYYTESAKKIASLTDSRVTFILKDGKVIGDSESDPLKMENHANREEIVSAKKDGVGYAIRHSHTLGENMLYVAEPVHSITGFDGYIRLSMSLAAVDAGLLKGWTVMIIGLIILFLAAVVVSYYVATGLTRPIEHITKVANQISNLDYNARVKLQRKDEIGQLGQAINGMADSLQNQLTRIRDNEDLLQNVLANMTNGIVMVDASGMIALVNREAERILQIKAEQVMGKSYNELKRYYELTKLIREGIVHRVRMHEEHSIFDPVEKLLAIDGVPMFDDNGTYRGMLFLLQDVTAIRRLERMRSEFVANVSHELKTPIAAVRGFAETLLSGGVTDEETAKSFLQIIYDESERLNRLIGDILELSKIESKRASLELSPVHLHSFFETVFEMMNTVAEKKHIRLKMDIPAELYIEADEDRIRQIFVNLLSNAINYTQEGGQVKVTAQSINEGQENEKVRFTVSDTGIGIPKKDLPRIFERFYRVDKARSRNSGGTGLGLSIVKHLVEMHHGTISVESELGIGTTFIIELPLVQEVEASM
ncbi:ATP-binding protein [Paenibacillus sediminis]|uniref:histidine kinase n=1 Tax=Paenibacillus sediminis TaxID=664909 RepID=A0ABS4H5K9_9BACL|nr:ATP-binding protein [Paenibacillus sediminis]MBP1937801.1 two-component system phosphate regulon sensor histidine kinase PhoR [Paenibacillus sediminis]